ncbi:chemotaxis protein CheW [Pokkaliibacter sp. MBI-7]|uniref:chemotaxis protein CheW n=1 Tax=Pokkaliibacter sp. MBI-7 TaxID=3040600 RepID=UPI0032661394
MSAMPATARHRDSEIDAMNAELEQFLTFLLADEEYAVDILRVQEIRVWAPVTRIPNSPPYLKGVLNLRGTIIPVIDLRCRFAMAQREYGPQTVVVVVRVMTDALQRTMGIVVDSVEETFAVAREQIMAAPHVGSNIDAEFVRGLISVDKKMIVLLDVDRLLNSDELAIEQTAE